MSEPLRPQEALIVHIGNLNANIVDLRREITKLSSVQNQLVKEMKEMNRREELRDAGFGKQS